MATCSESVVHFLRNAWSTSLGLAWSLHRNPQHHLGAEQERVRVIDAVDLEVLITVERVDDPLVSFVACASELG